MRRWSWHGIEATSHGIDLAKWKLPEEEEMGHGIYQSEIVRRGRVGNLQEPFASEEEMGHGIYQSGIVLLV